MKKLSLWALGACFAIWGYANAQNAGGRYDGLYSGAATLTKNNSPACAGSEHYNTALLIQNGTFRYLFNLRRQEFITGAVSSAGTIQAAGNSYVGGNQFDGTIQNGRLQATVGNAYCGYSLDLAFIPNMAGLKDGESCSRLRDICYQLSSTVGRKGCDDRFGECMSTGQWVSVILNRTFTATRN